MSKIRVMIVDDAVVVRRMVTTALSADPDIEIVATAANGSIALQRIAQINPDIITLDVEMPEMDGLTTLKQLRKTWPKLPVIMFSTLTERGASATLEALASGASDYVTKPANVGSVAIGLARVRDELVPKIKALVKRTADAASATTSQPANARPGALSAQMGAIGNAKPASIQPPAKVSAFGIDGPVVLRKPPIVTAAIEVLVIGISTGGPNALAEVIPALPGNLPVPVLIVQHMPPVFTRLLSERLNAKSQLRVHEATQGEIVSAGNVYIAPGDFHMTLVKTASGSRIQLNQDPAENSCRPAVDVLFRSVAKAYGPRTLGAVLTGMGNDGTRGGQAIVDAGGRMFAQDEATSVVWGMPGQIARAGLVEKLLPLKDVASVISSTIFSSLSISNQTSQVRKAG